MKRETTLKQNYEFRRAYNKGRSGVCPYVVIYARPNRSGKNRLGVTVSTKLGCAVARNRARRRLREVYRLSQPRMKKGFDIVLVARSRTVTGSYHELTQSYLKLCEKLGLMEENI